MSKASKASKAGKSVKDAKQEEPIISCERTTKKSDGTTTTIVEQFKKSVRVEIRNVEPDGSESSYTQCIRGFLLKNRLHNTYLEKPVLQGHHDSTFFHLSGRL